MRAFALLLLLPAVPAAAQTASTEPYSITRAGLAQDDVGAILEAGRGRYVAVADRLVDVASSTAAGQDVVLSQAEGEALAKSAIQARLMRLRAAAGEGRLTAQDRAEARALAVARGAALAWRDQYFLASLNPDEDPGAPLPAGAYAPAAPPEVPTPGSDLLAAQLRAQLILDDHGDPAQAEGLDMAVRLMLQSPTARELSAEFLKLNRRVKVSFERLDGGLVGGDDKHKYVSGVGGLTSHAEGDWVQLNAGYLQTDPRYQFSSVPGTLAHELLGHVYNDARAEIAGVTPAMNVWRGDEDTAGVTGWLVQAEASGKVPSDAYLWSYLADPEQHHRALHLVTAYYAQSVSPEEAGRLDEVYAERLGRVCTRIAELQARFDDRADWGAIMDHFVKVHAVDPWRFRGLRDELLHPSTAAARGELDRLLDVRRALTKGLADLKDPVRRAEQADAAKLMRDPFFADSEKRLAALSDRLRAFAAARKPAPAPVEVLAPGVTVTVVVPIGRDELKRMYQDDRRDHPEHWAEPPLARAPDTDYTAHRGSP